MPDQTLVDLGPELFGFPDGRVICYKGVNYVRQADAKQAIYEAAGFGTACIMSKPGLAGEVIMPTEELTEGCERLFQELNDGKMSPDATR
jgi:hypothetical protein